MSERVCIIIDGSNFYHRLRELGLADLLHFDYHRFAEMLSRARTITAMRYYVGAIREEQGNSKSKELMKKQRLLVGGLKKYGWDVRFGHMLKIDTIYHEKGVDVLMAVDLLVGAYEDSYDTAIIVSSDTDLVPVLDKIRSLGKKVEYIGFSHRPSYGLIAHSDIRRLFTKEDLQHLIPTK